VHKLVLFRLVLLIVVSAVPTIAAAGDLFPRPKQLEAAVEFWTRVYTEVDTRGGFIHDSERLDIVYETVPDMPSDAARRRHVDAAVARYRQILARLGGGARQGLSSEELRVRELFPDGTSNTEFRAAAERLRFQLGQSDRFLAGLIRSGIWRDYIQGVLAANGVPAELVALPHVESSFDPTAYSKAGAAGLWQFTRSTGVRYLQIDHVIDERRDPFLSTDAAARLLRDNYEVLGHWPLALTAYNHGLGGMRRAVSELGTTDMGEIAERYQGRTFGFASRNFYPAFLAAVDIDGNPEKYFGPVRLNGASGTIVTALPDYMTVQTLSRTTGIEVSRLRELNPALTAIVWNGDKYVPRGFPLRLPGSVVTGDPAAMLASIPLAERFAAQRPDVEHRVASGETLSHIASRYRVSVAALVEINGLRSSHMIRAGQLLKLPFASTDQVPAMLANSGVIPVSQPVTVRGAEPTAAQALVAMVDEAGPPEIVLAAAALGGEAPAALAIEPIHDAEPALDYGRSLDSNALASHQADLAADPSNYSVADGAIAVQPLETLGHYADWLEIRTQRLRDLNRLTYKQNVRLGQSLELDFSRVPPDEFERRRLAFHRQLQESFFSSHRIEDVEDHVILRGESLWVLAQRTYNVPVWLLRQYNPDLDLDRVAPGTIVKFPRLMPIT
jgi:membrane-bound lytic murein transglycosylase D